MSKSLPHLLKNEESSRVAEPLGATTRSSLHLTITNAQEEGPPTLPRKMGEDAQKGEEVSAFYISLPLRSGLGLQLSWSRNQETATAQLKALGSQERAHNTHDGNAQVTRGKSDGWAAGWRQRRLHVL